MQVIGIKELQTNPSKLTKVFQAKDYLLITKHGQPLGLALPFDEDLIAALVCTQRVSKWGSQLRSTQQNTAQKPT